MSIDSFDRSLKPYHRSQTGTTRLNSAFSNYRALSRSPLILTLLCRSAIGIVCSEADRLRQLARHCFVEGPRYDTDNVMALLVLEWEDTVVLTLKRMRIVGLITPRNSPKPYSSPLCYLPLVS